MKNYDLTKESKFIIDLDANNLYCEFKWVENVDNFDVNSISKGSLYGYILKVDVEYPDESHKLHDDYPLAPEKLKIT